MFFKNASNTDDGMFGWRSQEDNWCIPRDPRIYMKVYKHKVSVSLVGDSLGSIVQLEAVSLIMI